MARTSARPALAPSLKANVKTVEAALGRVIVEAEGRALYEKVEAVRRLMVAFREGNEAEKRRSLARAAQLLKKLSPSRRAAFAKAYTLYLELVNACENAYRTHRLKKRPLSSGGPIANAVFVLTAHPTESRSPANIGLLRRLQTLLVEAFDNGAAPRPAHLKHLLHLLWRAGTHPKHKPTVEDEARHVCSMLDDAALEELLRLKREGHSVRIRTWVGGDKDGHPGVGPKQTAASLALSRERLLEYLERVFAVAARDAEMTGDVPLREKTESVRAALPGLSRLSDGDGAKVRELASRVQRLAGLYEGKVGAPHPQLGRCLGLLELFPALVVPLELREERGLFGPGSVIVRMLRYVRRVSEGGPVNAYVRGLVVSMTETAADLLEADSAVRHVFGGAAIPIIPLFETPDVLERSVDILREAYKRKAWRRMIKARGRRLEVMLGYSDTSKRMGSFPSRLAIKDVMSEIEAWGAEKKVGLVFFHGSGGSEGRGGGTIREQAAAWPAEALGLLKATIQGEMVERTFASPEILRSLVGKIAEAQADPPARGETSRFARELARLAAGAFAGFAASEDLRRFLARATPYARLDRLTIGSRPSRRSGSPGAGIEKLRAIPWVLCWTQTRFLLPVWFGLGTAWRTLRKKPGAAGRLKAAAAKDPLLKSFLRLLGFALSKAEPSLFSEYVRVLAPETPKDFLGLIEAERRDVLDLVRRVEPKGLLWDRAWLKESIYYRAPMIHPLNLLQIQVLSKKRLTQAEELLFRETVTGIAAGMLTTG